MFLISVMRLSVELLDKVEVDDNICVRKFGPSDDHEGQRS